MVTWQEKTNLFVRNLLKTEIQVRGFTLAVQTIDANVNHVLTICFWKGMIQQILHLI